MSPQQFPLCHAILGRKGHAGFATGQARPLPSSAVACPMFIACGSAFCLAVLAF